jgi:hypothetical protein
MELERRKNVVPVLRCYLAQLERNNPWTGSHYGLMSIRSYCLFLLRYQQQIFALRGSEKLSVNQMAASYRQTFETKRNILQKASRIADNIDSIDDIEHMDNIDRINNTVDKTLKYYAMVIKNLDKWSKTIHKKLLDEMVAQYHTLPSNLPMDLKSYVVAFITPKGVFH